MKYFMKIVDCIHVYHDYRGGIHSRYLWFCPIEVDWFHGHGIQVGGPYDDSVNIEQVKSHIALYLSECFEAIKENV